MSEPLTLCPASALDTPARARPRERATTSTRRGLTGAMKLALYTVIALHVAVHFAVRPRLLGWSPRRYLRFVLRAARLLISMWPHQTQRTPGGFKLQLYVPAYPSRPFFRTLEGKLLQDAPCPTSVVFSMTKRCQYKCPHCYQKKDRARPLDTERMLQTAARIERLGVSLFNIEGGEPFTDYPRLLPLVTQLGGRSEVWVNTTGAGVQPFMLHELRDAGMQGVMVSIHASDAARHDDFTGVSGSFALACQTLRTCRAAGLGAAINSVLSSEAVADGELDRIMELARELDCDYVQLIHPKPAGQWLARCDDMAAQDDQLERVRAAHLDYNSRHRRGYPALSAQLFEESRDQLGCTAGGVDRFYLNASGEVQPCEFLNISFGNVADERFETIFARMREAFARPCSDWLCCTQAAAIHALAQRHGVTALPLPWALTRELVERWQRGPATALYERLGIYS